MGRPEIFLTAAMVAAFAAIHLFISRLHFFERTPRSKWLSFSGGVAVAYVFLHILPDLGAYSASLAQRLGERPIVAESMVYALALAGLATFYGLERQVKVSRERSQRKGDGDLAENGVFCIHVGSYTLFNLLIAYLLLRREEMGGWALGLYFVAMALHFVTADFGMRQQHEAAYDQWGRWVLVAGALAGWALGVAFALPIPVVAGMFAYLAGGVVLSVLKEELPEERESFFLPFLGGIVGIAALTLIERLAF